MDILKQAKINVPQLRNYIKKKAANELSKLSRPCYYPKTKLFYYELLNMLNLNDKDFKEFVKHTIKGSKAEKWKSALWTDPGTFILLLLMHIFLQNRDKTGFTYTLLYFMIVHYSRLMHRQLQYCNEDVFLYTLDNLTRTHLFFREKSIPNALYHLAKGIEKKFIKEIKEWDKDGLVDFVITARTRISQSVKSFAKHYYRNKEEGSTFKTQEDPNDEENNYQQQTLQRGQRVVDKIVKKLTVYRTVDRKAFAEAKKLSKAKTSTATIIAQNLIDRKYSEKIKIALQLFLKGVQDADLICGDKYYKYVKKLMEIKRSKSQIYFKAQINILLKEILEDSGYLEAYNKYTSQTQFTLNLFLAYYLTLVLRHDLC